MNIEQYYLMHKNIISSLVSIDTDTGHVIDTAIIDDFHSPISRTNKNALANWWERRAIPNTKEIKIFY